MEPEVTPAMFYFYAESRPALGHGHLSRCLALAHRLHEHGKCHFAITPNPQAADIIAKQGFETTLLASDRDLILWVSTLNHPAVLILDFKEPRPFPYELVKQLGLPLVMIDHATDAIRYADLVIYPNAHFHYEALDWSHFSGEILAGPSYNLLRDIFFSAPPLPFEDHEGVMITLGGSDPHQLTPRLMKACLELPKNVPIHVFIGANFSNKHEILQLNTLQQNRFILHEQTELYPYIRKAGLVLTALGITIYECASQHTPVAILLNYDSDQEDALALEKKGVVVFGHHTRCLDSELSKAITHLWRDSKKRLDMSKQSQNLVQGNGLIHLIPHLLKLV